MCVRERESVLLCSDGWEKHKDKEKKKQDRRLVYLKK
jgi:hypothetical protein